MPDLAALRVSFDPTGLQAGHTALQSVVRTADQAGKAADALGRGIEQAGRKTETASKAVDAHTRMIERQLKMERDLERHLKGTGGMYEQLAREMAKVDAATVAASGGLTSMGAAATVANDNIRLTRGQVQGLGYQINDVGTMLAMGASPFQVMASQAGQVVQVLGDGPRGVRGSLIAMKNAAIAGGASLASALGPVGIAVAGVTAAVGALAYAFRDSLPDAATVLERHSQILDRVTSQYDDLKTKLEAIGEAEQAIGLRVELEIDRRDLERQIKAEMQNVDVGFTDRFATQFEFGFKDFDEGSTKRLFDPIRQQVDTLREALKRGETDAVIPFRKQMEYLHEVAGDDQEMRTAIEAALEYTKTLAGLTARADEASLALERMGIAEKGGRLRTPTRDQERGLMDRMDPEGAEDIRKALKDQADALTETTTRRRTARTEAERYSDTLERQRYAIEREVDSLRAQVDGFGMTEGAAAALRFEMGALAEARRAAAAAGQVVTPGQIADIKTAAGEISTMTDRLAALNKEKALTDRRAEFMANLDFETSIAKLPEAERKIAAPLRDIGITFEEETGE